MTERQTDRIVKDIMEAVSDRDTFEAFLRTTLADVYEDGYMDGKESCSS